MGFAGYKHGVIETTTVAFPAGESIGIYIVTTGTCVITLRNGATLDLGSPPTGTIIPMACNKYAGTAVVASLY
jgi:hypothetical protein